MKKVLILLLLPLFISCNSGVKPVIEREPAIYGVVIDSDGNPVAGANVWLLLNAPNEPGFMVEDIISSVSPVPLAEIHSTHDEFLPLERARQ